MYIHVHILATKCHKTWATRKTTTGKNKSRKTYIFLYLFALLPLSSLDHLSHYSLYFLKYPSLFFLPSLSFSLQHFLYSCLPLHCSTSFPHPSSMTLSTLTREYLSYLYFHHQRPHAFPLFRTKTQLLQHSLLHLIMV